LYDLNVLGYIWFELSTRPEGYSVVGLCPREFLEPCEDDLWYWFLGMLSWDGFLREACLGCLRAAERSFSFDEDGGLWAGS
jgi:hypothetical protein